MESLCTGVCVGLFRVPYIFIVFVIPRVSGCWSCLWTWEHLSDHDSHFTKSYFLCYLASFFARVFLKSVILILWETNYSYDALVIERVLLFVATHESGQQDGLRKVGKQSVGTRTQVSSRPVQQPPVQSATHQIPGPCLGLADEQQLCSPEGSL